jgi:hypothetical protein
MAAITGAVPVFLGVILGIFAAYSGLAWPVILGVIVLLCITGALFRASARAVIGTAPVAAVRLWQGAVLIPVALIAGTAYAMAGLGDAVAALVPKLPAWAATGTADPDRAKGLSDALTGAFATLVAGLWLDDAKKPESRFWPPAQLALAFEAAFRKVVNAYKGPNPPHPGLDHRELERAITGTDTGWGLADALARARKVAGYL